MLWLQNIDCRDFTGKIFITLGLRGLWLQVYDFRDDRRKILKRMGFVVVPGCVGFGESVAGGPVSSFLFLPLLLLYGIGWNDYVFIFEVVSRFRAMGSGFRVVGWGLTG